MSWSIACSKFASRWQTSCFFLQDFPFIVIIWFKATRRRRRQWQPLFPVNLYICMNSVLHKRIWYYKTERATLRPTRFFLSLDVNSSVITAVCAWHNMVSIHRIHQACPSPIFHLIIKLLKFWFLEFLNIPNTYLYGKI